MSEETKINRDDTPYRWLPLPQVDKRLECLRLAVEAGKDDPVRYANRMYAFINGWPDPAKNWPENQTGELK